MGCSLGQYQKNKQKDMNTYKYSQINKKYIMNICDAIKVQMKMDRTHTEHCKPGSSTQFNENDFFKTTARERERERSRKGETHN